VNIIINSTSQEETITTKMSTEAAIFIDLKVTTEDIENKTYFCNEPSCSKRFSSEKGLKKHIAMFHKQIKISALKSTTYRFNCPIETCKRSLKKNGECFTSRKHLHQHFYKVHNTGRFSCGNQDCKKKYSTEMLRNLHQKSCGKIFTCHCNCVFNSREALLTHQRRKHPTMKIERKKEMNNNETIKKKSDNSSTTRTVSTTTSGLGLWNSTENLSLTSASSNMTSVFTSTDCLISSMNFETKPTETKLIKNSSTSTADDFTKEENSNSLSSSSSQNKKSLNWNISGEFDDSLNLFDSDVKMEFYSAETQTDFSENLFNNNYTQTTFSDFYDFEKFDIQTQTNWDE
jgi:hypothetical protein